MSVNNFSICFIHLLVKIYCLCLVQAFSLYCAYMMESSKEANFFGGSLWRSEGANSRSKRANHKTLILWRSEGANSKRANPRSESANSKRANLRSEGTNSRSM